MADYSSPKPVDPLWYQQRGYLHITCRCGRKAVYPLQAFARFRRVDKSLKLYQLIERLRCELCGQRPSHAEVTRRG